MEFQSRDPMIGLVIRLRQSMSSVLTQIANQLPNLALEFSTQPEYFGKFAISVFLDRKKPGRLDY